MDDVQLIAWICAFIAGLVSVSIAIRSFKKSIKERQLDLLWKQANSAREIVREIHDNKNASDAVLMLDGFLIDKPELLDARLITIAYEEVLAALPKISNKSYSEKEHYILLCFDWLFYYIDRLEQYISDGLIRYDNVKYIFYCYYKKIRLDKEIFYTFMKERNYVLAPRFWERYVSDADFQNL